MPIQFKKAVKHDAKGRIALIGPAGSGKSYTMLEVARLLAGPDGKIAAIDTEHGSLSKYADMFNFDVMELDSFTPTNFIDALDAAENNGYAVFCADSLSHFWTGKDGALEFVDSASKRHRDNQGGWKDFRPHERMMVDRMVSSPCHILVTMRTKNDYIEEVNPATGKKQRRKVGLAPVQREGLEYEFDMVGYMDDDNTFIVDKTRCSSYAGKAIAKPSAKDFVPFRDWLSGAPRESSRPTVAPSTSTPSVGGTQSRPAVQQPHSAPPANRPQPAEPEPKKADPTDPYIQRIVANKADMDDVFDELAKAIIAKYEGNEESAAKEYIEVFAKHGVITPNDCKTRGQLRKLISDLIDAGKSQVAVAA